MATVYRDNRKSSTRQYIATAAFNSYFWTYTVSTDPNTFAQTGSFSAVSGANAGNCPKGRILRETGERLFPGQSGVNTLMVKVFDPYSFLSGYIDPNAEVFAPFNTDKPGDVTDGFDNNGTSVAHRGPSMYTSGNILADGSLKVGGTADISGALTVVSGGIILAGGTNTSAFSATTGPSVFTPNSQSFYKLTSTGAVALTCTALPTSGRALTIIFAGNNTVTPGAGFVTTATIAPGTGSIIVNFVSTGTNLLEVSRTAAFATSVAGPA